MDIIIKDQIVLARHIKSNDVKDGLSFFTNVQDCIQVGSWCYSKDKELAAHVHNEVERNVTRTYEVMYVISGKIETTIYTLSHEEVCKLIIDTGDTIVLQECGHGYKNSRRLHKSFGGQKWSISWG